jgi:hypothetical protein
MQKSGDTKCICTTQEIKYEDRTAVDAIPALPTKHEFTMCNVCITRLALYRL